MSMVQGTPFEDTVLEPVTAEMLRAFAEAAGDPNPIHLNEDAARQAGLPGIIAHGMLVASWVSRRAQDLIVQNQPGARLTGFQARFKGMTRLGDRLRIRATLQEKGPGEPSIELEASIEGSGQVVVVAHAGFRALH